MADLAVLKAASDVAEVAKEKLLAERRTNRDAMTKQAFRDYNESTHDQQLDIQAACDAADKEFQDALKVIRSDAVETAINVAVGTLNESNTVGDMNG